jgi:hypothetical protein
MPTTLRMLVQGMRRQMAAGAGAGAGPSTQQRMLKGKVLHPDYGLAVVRGVG